MTRLRALLVLLLQGLVPVAMAVSMCPGTVPPQVLNVSDSVVVSTGPYSSNWDCRISLLSSSIVQWTVRFNSFATEARYDFFYVYDSVNVPSGNYVFRQSGVGTPSAVSVISDAISLRLTTDGSIVNSGVTVTVTASIPDLPEADSMSTSVVVAIAVGVACALICCSIVAAVIMARGRNRKAGRAANPVAAAAVPNNRAAQMAYKHRQPEGVLKFSAQQQEGIPNPLLQQEAVLKSPAERQGVNPLYGAFPKQPANLAPLQPNFVAQPVLYGPDVAPRFPSSPDRAEGAPQYDLPPAYEEIVHYDDVTAMQALANQSAK